MSETQRRNHRRTTLRFYFTLSLVVSLVALLLSRDWLLTFHPLLRSHASNDSITGSGLATKMQGKKHIGYFVSSLKPWSDTR